MIDLHAHTKASDGENTPSKLIDMAIDIGLSAIAVTDHDNVDGIEEAYNYSKGKNILFIPGIEMAASCPGGKMHILGLFVDYKNETLKDKLNKIIEYRNVRNANYIRELNQMGYNITEEDLKSVSNGKVIGKPHFAKLFIQKGYITSKSEMFDDFFNKPPLNQYKKFSYTPQEVITMLKEAGSVVILAHPQSLNLDIPELTKKIEELKEYGLDGIECYHSDQTPEQMAEYKKIAIDLNLIYTKGSDYHGPIVKPEIALGYGKNGNIVSDEEDFILKQLLEYKKNKTNF